MEAMTWLQNWYKAQCNGDWEHSYGIKIETIDNPGWHIEIDLAETEFENLSLPAQFHETSETDWYSVEIKESKYFAFGDLSKFNLLIEKFKDLISGISQKGSKTNKKSPQNSYKNELNAVQTDVLSVV